MMDVILYFLAGFGACCLLLLGVAAVIASVSKGDEPDFFKDDDIN
jgi:hypothetical protein